MNERHMLCVHAAGASAADIAAARLGRSLKLWLDLQASVNGFIDSTTADKGVLVSSWPAETQCMSPSSSSSCGSWQATVCKACLAAVVWEPAKGCHQPIFCFGGCAGHPPAIGKEGGAFPQEHDGQAS